MHIGNKIKNIFEEKSKKCDIKWFASQLHCEPRNIYRIFNRTNIDISLLKQISIVLNYDFFQDLSKEYNNQKDNCHNETINVS